MLAISGLSGRFFLQLAHYLAIETVHFAVTGQRHQFHRTLLAWLETHGGASGDIEAHAIGTPALEGQRRVDFKKVEMRTDLYRPVTPVGYHHRGRCTVDIETDLAFFQLIFTGDHAGSLLFLLSGLKNAVRYGIGWCTVTSLLPSGKVASTWISGIISATPSITSSRVSICAPSDISRATDLPSRAPSMMAALIKATASG